MTAMTMSASAVSPPTLKGKSRAELRRAIMRDPQWRPLLTTLRVAVPMALLFVFCVGGLTMHHYRMANAVADDAAVTTLSGARSLLSSVEDPTCNNSLEADSPVGAVVVYFIGIIYSFVGLAVVCDEYFVASLTIISEALHLSEDVAGATFMASASSAPELFTNVVDTFGESNNIGVGTIVGSAMFNILVIIAASGVFSKVTLTVDWRPMVRDIAFYTVAIACMVGFFVDGEVTWWESALLLFGYVLYVAFMVYNERILSRCDKSQASLDDDAAQEQAAADKKAKEDAEAAADKAEAAAADKDKDKDKAAAPATDAEDVAIVVDATPTNTDVSGQGRRKSIPKLSELTSEVRTSFTKIVGLEADDDADPDAPPLTPVQRVVYFLNPLTHVNLLLSLTIPNCDEEHGGRFSTGYWYVLTFILSICWIGGFSWVLVTLCTRVGCLFHIPPILMGVTVLAIGTSIPDFLSSIVAARQGSGDMAVSNAIGSNVFDIFIGLGLPWTIKTLITDYDTVIDVDDDSLIIPSVILFSTVVAVLLVMVLSGWKLTRNVGISLFALYIAFVAYNIVEEAL